MSNADRSVLAELRAELAGLSGDLQEMVALRLQLASLELRAALGQLKGLALALAIAAVMGITALPLLAVAVAEWIDGWLGLTQGAWLLTFAVVLVLVAVLLATLAWHTFRRRFVGLEETLEELREDAIWLREWTSAPTSTSDTPPRPAHHSARSPDVPSDRARG